MDNNDSMKPQQTGGLKLMTVFIAVLALHVLVIGGFTVYHLMGSGTSDADLTLDKTHKLKADGTAITDSTAPDATTADKASDATAPATGSSADTASTTTPSAPAPDATATTSSESVPPVASANPPVAPAPPAIAPATPSTPAQPTPIVITSQDMAQSSAIAPGLAPPPEPTPGSVAPAAPPTPVSTPAPTPSAVASESAASSEAPAPEAPLVPSTSGPIMPDNSVASGPVHMPAMGPNTGSMQKTTASTEEHGNSLGHEAKHEIYTVKITDSYKKIAHAHHITVAQLKEANHIRDNVLRTGQKLIIPLERTSLAKGDASPEVGTPSRVVLSDTNSTASLSASPATEHHHRHIYTVAKGDTLKYIARKFNVTTVALKDANNLNSTKLTVGEKLKIPSKEARSAGTTVPTQAQPSQVETQPTPIAPIAQPAPVEPPAPQPTPASNPELANLTF